MKDNDELTVDAVEQEESAIDEAEGVEQVSYGNIETAGVGMYLVVGFGVLVLLYSVWKLVEVFPW